VTLIRTPAYCVKELITARFVILARQGSCSIRDITFLKTPAYSL